MTFQMKEIGCEVSDEDIILVLTRGLPQLHENFITILDATDPENLTIKVCHGYRKTCGFRVTGFVGTGKLWYLIPMHNHIPVDALMIVLN